MSARLLTELDAERTKCQRRADGYRMAGERRLAGMAERAAQACRAAAHALNELAAAEGEARELEREA